jgi:uroporphyrinogen decarboxylase
MTSRERVLAAVERREPDRVPVDLGATPSSGISAIAYGRLARHLGIRDGRARVYDVVQQLAQPEDWALDRFGVDAVDIGRAFNAEDSAWRDVRLPDGRPARYPAWFRPEARPDGSAAALRPDGLEIALMPAGATFFDQRVFPYLDGYPADFGGLDAAMAQVLWAALPHSPWDHASEPGFWDDLRTRTLALRRATDRALVVAAGCNLFEWGTFLRRGDHFLMDLAAEPARVEALLDALLERHLATLDRVCAAVGDLADIIRLGDDLGGNAGPLISPSMYRRFFKPRHARLCDAVRRRSGMRTLLHSCGSIRALLPDLIEAGFEIINPVQTDCAGMDPAGLKRDFGRDVCFWGGGCDTRRVLPAAGPAEVKDHVRRRLEIFATGGGFVFSAVHNILPDVPPANVVAMFEAVAAFNG